MIIFLFSLLLIQTATCIDLSAVFSQNGLHGNLTFDEQEGQLTVVSYFKFFKHNLSEQNWSWGIHEFPVQYDNVNSESRCKDTLLGTQLYNLNLIFGELVLSENETVRHFDISVLKDGLESFWGRSIVLYSTDSQQTVCSSILTSAYENIAEARFQTSVLGSIIIRSLSSKNGETSRTLLYTNLGFAPRNASKTYKKVSSSSWKIFTTDVFIDNSDDAQEMNCNNLQILYDPYNAGIGKSIGDLDVRLGKLQISSFNTLIRNKQAFVDKKLLLTLNDYSSSTRKLYIVIYDDSVPNKYIACAKIRPINSKVFKALINGNGLKGDITWEQKSLFEPTHVNVSLGSVYTNKRSWLEYARDLGNIFVSLLPPKKSLVGNSSYCTNYSSGALYNPTEQRIPDRGVATQDEYPIGDLTGKLWDKNIRTTARIIHNSYELNGIYWDLYSPLIGYHSILHRGVIITRKQQNDSEPWVCSTIAAFDPKKKNNEIQMTTATVTFKYPIVGQIFFSQPTNSYWDDTTIIIEYLIHADGAALNTSYDHKFAIHDHAPGKDFYDWQNRCLSTGNIFNPYSVFVDEEEEFKSCSKENNIACRIGDLYNNVGTLTISGSKKENFLSRKLFTMTNLPLGGKNKILGRSVVIYDDFGPKARGERLACSSIEYVQARKAVVKDWFGNGETTNVMGKFEFTQQTQYDITNIEQAISGRSPNKLYAIHEVPVAINLEFPCEPSSIDKMYNPSNINSDVVPRDGTLDYFELGNLSGKFSSLGESEMKNESYTDNQMTLFGYNSIIGRSIVISDKNSLKNVACGTIERGYSSRDSRESRAIVSFHHPLGFAYGYIRLSQLIGLVSGQSDTTVEINLRYPGLHDRNKTMNHLFKIYVNPVGVDAVVKQTVTRCTAGGYVWNPYYTQLADPRNDELYRNECSSDNPYRCYVGDVSARIGTINIGHGRQLLTDSNFPLDGAVSAVGRSIVIFGPERSSEIFACANIEPDHNIIKYVNIERPPRFVTAQFLEDVREVMGVPEWFLEVDSRKTKLLYDNACVQLVIYFRGPIASRLEQDFSKLLIFGRLDSPSLYIPGYQNPKRKSTIQHKECSIKDGNKTKRKQLNKYSKIITSTSPHIFYKTNFILVALQFLVIISGQLHV